MTAEAEHLFNLLPINQNPAGADQDMGAAVQEPYLRMGSLKLLHSYPFPGSCACRRLSDLSVFLKQLMLMPNSSCSYEVSVPKRTQQKNKCYLGFSSFSKPVPHSLDHKKRELLCFSNVLSLSLNCVILNPFHIFLRGSCVMPKLSMVVAH